jgi:hypothetical protein
MMDRDTEGKSTVYVTETKTCPHCETRLDRPVAPGAAWRRAA